MNNKRTIYILVAIAVALAILTLSTQHRAQEPDFAKPQKPHQDTKAYFEIPELGIKFEKSEELYDLQYTTKEYAAKTENPQTLVFFSAKSILDKATALKDSNGLKYCTAENGPLGALTTTRQYPNDGDRPLPPDTKIIGGIYVSYSGPQATCTKQDEVQKIITQKIEALKNALSTLQSLSGELVKNLEQGTIEGSLVPPAKGSTNQMQVCAINTSSNESFCSGLSYLNDKRFTRGIGYQIIVPAGKYKVYASLAKNPRDPNAYRAFYSEYVECIQKLPAGSKDLSACDKHDPITVEVKNGETTESIDPFDWNNTGSKDVISGADKIIARKTE